MGGPRMASLTINGLPEQMQDELRRQAARNGRSPNKEALARLASTFLEHEWAQGVGETKEERVQRLLALRDSLLQRHPAPDDNTTVDDIVRLVRQDRDFAHRYND